MVSNSIMIGPLTYKASGNDLIEKGYLGSSFERVIVGVMKLMLNNYDGDKRKARIDESKHMIASYGVWGFSNTYWDSSTLHIRSDPFGLGNEKNRPFKKDENGNYLFDPANYRSADKDPRVFREFTPEEFIYCPETEFLGDSFDWVAKLSKKNNLPIVVTGLTPRRQGLVVGKVCALEFKLGKIMINLAEDENMRHMALGQRPEDPDQGENPRFSLP